MRRLVSLILYTALAVGGWTCSPARAGDVILNGVNMGKFTSLVINYKIDKTGLVVITTKVPLTTAPPVVGGFELVKCFRSKMDLYLFVRENKYPGSVFVDGVRLRSGAKAPVLYQTGRDGSVCRS